MTSTTDDLARRIRLGCLAMCHTTKASHRGGAFSVADVRAVLYGGVLRKDPAQPKAAQQQ